MQNFKKKLCSKCKAEKFLDEFNNNPRMKLGKMSRCRVCAREANKKARIEKPESYCWYNKEAARKHKEYWSTHNPYDNQNKKHCPCCLKDKFRLEFDKCLSIFDGLQSWCRECSTNRKFTQIVPMMLMAARSRAKNNGLEFKLTKDSVQVPDICPVLGIPLFPKKGKAGPNSPSLDRVDNSKGYIPGNVRVISYRANLLKNDATIDEIKRVLTYMESYGPVATIK